MINCCIEKLKMPRHEGMSFLKHAARMLKRTFQKLLYTYSAVHGLINYKDTKTKCRHLTKLTCKGTCGRCLLEFIYWRYSQSCWYFWPSFVNNWPSNRLPGSTPPALPPSLCQITYAYRQWVASRGWGRGRGCCALLETIFAEFNTL